MKTTCIVSLLFILGSLKVVSAQSEPKPAKKVRITEMSFQAGLIHQPALAGSEEDFRRLAPNSGIMNPGPFTDVFRGSGTMITSMYTALMGLQFGDPAKSTCKRQPVLRLGLTYMAGNNLQRANYVTTRSSMDTLVSSQTGQMIFVDTVKSNGYSMNYSSDQIRLDISLIYRSKSERRFSFYGGLGLNAGFSVNANTGILATASSRTEYHLPDGNTTSSMNWVGEQTRFENVRNRTNFGMSAFAPLGLNFRMGKEQGAGNRAHLYYEIKPGLNMTVVPELGTLASPSVQHGIGVRYNW